MSQKVLRCYQKAGRIASDVRKSAQKVVREGMPVLEVCEKIEKLIRDKGGKPAFPCNVCINEVAAHYTSPPNDKKIIPENSIVKIDLGVQVDGYIADTATSVCFNPEYDEMLYATEEALMQAIKIIRSGIKVSKIGSVVENVVKLRGYKVIWNLTGHKVGRYLIHTGKFIPNVSEMNGTEIAEGEVYAIEPFITLVSAKGEVKSGQEAYIFQFKKERSSKDSEAKILLNVIKNHFKTLPFAERWLWHLLPREEFKKAFLKLLNSRSLMAYKVLFEVSGGVVAQAEHTVLVKEDGYDVLTL